MSQCPAGTSALTLPREQLISLPAARNSPDESCLIHTRGVSSIFITRFPRVRKARGRKDRPDQGLAFFMTEVLREGRWGGGYEPEKMATGAWGWGRPGPGSGRSQVAEGAECSRPQAASQTSSSQAGTQLRVGRVSVRTLMLGCRGEIPAPGRPFHVPGPQLPYLQSGDNDGPDFTAIN